MSYVRAVRRLQQRQRRGVPGSALLSACSARSQSTNAVEGHVLRDEYKRRADGGLITYDPVQSRAVRHLDALYDQLLEYGGPEVNEVATAPAPSGQSWWQRLTGGDSVSSSSSSASVLSTEVPKGLYIHGGVGCGKVRGDDLTVDVEVRRRC